MQFDSAVSFLVRRGVPPSPPPGTLPDGCEVAQERECKEPPTPSHLSWDGRGHTEMPGQRVEGQIMLCWCLRWEREIFFRSYSKTETPSEDSLWRVKSECFLHITEGLGSNPTQLSWQRAKR